MDTVEQTSELEYGNQADAPISSATATVAQTAGTDVPDFTDTASADAFLKAWAAGDIDPPSQEPTQEVDDFGDLDDNEGGEQVPPAPKEDPEAKNWRLTANSDFDREAFAIHKAARGEKTMAEVVAWLQQSKAQPGPTETKETATENPTPSDVQQGPRTLAQLDAEKIQLQNAILEAREMFDNRAADELQFQLNELTLERVQAIQIEAEALRKAQEAAESEATQAARAQWDGALAKAQSEYPASAQRGSALWNEMIRVDQELQRQGNPLYNAVDKAYHVTMMAANRLGIAPVMDAPPPVAQARPSVRPRPLSGGSSSQGSGVVAAPSGWDNINSVEQLEAVLATL